MGWSPQALANQRSATGPLRPYRAKTPSPDVSLHLARSTNMDKRLSVGASKSALQARASCSGPARQAVKVASRRPLAEQ
ncbi:MAG: hypothetical protein ACK559_27635 [bacterium]